MTTDYEGTYDDADTAGDFDEDDIFAGAPKAINFSEEFEKGKKYRMQVLGRPELVQGWDDKAKKPATWPDSGQPRMNGVIRVMFNDEPRSLWMGKPSALWRGVQEASRAARVSIREGGWLELEYGGLGKKERGLNAPHLFPSVTYEPPTD